MQRCLSGRNVCNQLQLRLKMRVLWAFAWQVTKQHYRPLLLEKIPGFFLLVQKEAVEWKETHFQIYRGPHLAHDLRVLLQTDTQSESGLRHQSSNRSFQYLLWTSLHLTRLRGMEINTALNAPLLPNQSKSDTAWSMCTKTLPVSWRIEFYKHWTNHHTAETNQTTTTVIHQS